MTAAPTLPGRRDAPTTATDRGCSTCWTAATRGGALALLEAAPAVLGQGGGKGDL